MSPSYCARNIIYLNIKFNTLSIYYQNTRGLRTKTFMRNLTTCNYDIIILTETELNTELFDDSYNVFRRDSQSSGFHGHKDGGRVLKAVSNNIFE